MSTELFEKGGVTLTRFAGYCEVCHPNKVSPCYQFTGPNGWVAICADCLGGMVNVVIGDTIDRLEGGKSERI